MSVLGSGCPLLRRYCCELLCPGAVKNRGVWFSPVGPNGSSHGCLQRLWLANQEKKGRGRGRGAWRTRTVRGERQALIVASSLAVNRSSCSCGLKATELTTSSCRSLARQML